MKKILLCCLSLCFISCEKVVEIKKSPIQSGSQSYEVCTSELSRDGISEARREKGVDSASCIIETCQPGYEKLNLKEYIVQRNDSLTFESANMAAMSIESVAAEYPMICMKKQKSCSVYGIADGETTFVYQVNPNVIGPLLSTKIEATVFDPMETFGYNGCQPKTSESCSENFVYSEYKDQNNVVTYKICASNKVSCIGDLPDTTGVAVASVYFDSATNSYPYETCAIESCQSGYTLTNNSCVLNPTPPLIDPCLINPMMCMNPCMINPASCVPQ